MEKRVRWPGAEDDVEQDLPRRRAAPRRAPRAQLVHELAHALVTGPAQAERFGVLAEPAIDLGDREVGIVQLDEGFITPLDVPLVIRVSDLLANDYDIKFSIEPKPNEPRGDLYLPTVGSVLAFITTLDHPEMCGINPETAHIKMAGLNPYHEFAQALDAGKYNSALNSMVPSAL